MDYSIVCAGFIITACISFMANSAVFCSVIRKYIYRDRPVLILIGHLAVLAFLVPFLNCFVSSDQFQIIDFDQSYCRLVSYAKTVVHCAYAVNMVFIVHELIGSIRPDTATPGALKLARKLLAIWVGPIIFSLPTWWMIQPKDEYLTELRADGNMTLRDKVASVREKCVSVPLMESKQATIMYELVRLILFYLVVAICMVAAAFNVHSKLKFLSQVVEQRHQDRLQRQVRSVRLIYFYLLTVILLWLPSGVIIFCRRVLPRLMDHDRSGERRNTFVKKLATFAVLGYLSICPLISYIFIENPQIAPNILYGVLSNLKSGFGLSSGDSSHGTETSKEGDESRRRSSSKSREREMVTEGLQHGNTSRFSTLAFTPTWTQVVPEIPSKSSNQNFQEV